MPAYKDVGHPMGWLAYEWRVGHETPRWVGKRKSHKSDGNGGYKPMHKQGPVRGLYALSLLSRGWHGYYDPQAPYSKTQTFDYIAWCMFWSVPVVELTRKLLDRTITHVEEDQLREYLGKIPAHPPIATGHRQPADSE